MNKLYIKLLSFFISIIDQNNKNKIISFFKTKFKDKKLNIIDVGAHKGETILLFMDNLDVSKILAFEANPHIFNELKKKIKKLKDSKKIDLFNVGIGEKVNKKTLQIFNDTSSSTFNSINKESLYYKRKQFFLSFFKKNILSRKETIRILPISDLQEFNKLKTIDILKIDTEGYEYNVLKGVKEKDLEKITYIYFEHHYDLMIKKNYKFYDIDKLLKKNHFVMKFKIRMKLRKTFEYIYENTKK